MRSALAGVAALVVLAGAPAAAQSSSAPGPWVLDIRAATSSVPTDLALYATPTAAVVPARAFGLDLGGNVYLFNFGPARVGVGANILMVRSTARDEPTIANPDATQRLTLNLRTVAPQLSVNFGSRDGWSYLSAGLGTASLTTRVEGERGGERESGQVRSVNFGGGARWFITERLAFGFDLRAHRIAAGNETPRSSTFAVGAGLSIR